MARDDFNRRRLRGMYERNKGRVSALADARDRRRDSDREEAAPRRYVVSERRTRVEGFGRGGQQVRRVVRSIERRPRGGSRRFSDRGLFRRGARDRFVRDDDVDREIRRERFREDERSRRGARGGDRARRGGGEGGSRFGVSRRLRLREKERKASQPTRSGRRGGRGGNNNNNSNNSNNNNNNNRGQRAVGSRGGASRRGQGGDKGGNRQSQPQQQQQQQQHKSRGGERGGARGGRGDRQRDAPMPSHADLDRQLESYRGN